MPPVIVSVVDQFTQPDGTPDSGTVRFRPLVPLRFTDSPLTLGSSYRTYTLDSQGKLNGTTGIPLIANDSPNITPENTCWLVRFDITNASFESGKEYPFVLYAADTSPVNLAARIRDTLDLSPSYVYALERDLVAHEADVSTSSHAAHVVPDNTTIVITNGVLSSVSGTGDKHYTHNQLSPATTWTVDHNLNKEPAVTVVDSGGTEIWGDVTYPGLNQVVIQFANAFGGKAYCN